MINNKEWLFEKYIKEGLSLRDIAKLLDRSNRRQIKKKLNEFSIPIRDLRDARKNRTKFGRVLQRTNNELVNNKEWLLDQYVTQNKSIGRISDETGVSPESIRRRLVIAGVKIKTCNEVRIGMKHSAETKTKMSQTASQQIVNGTRSSHCHGNRYNCYIAGKLVEVKSSWERDYADYLTKNNIKFEYEPRSFQLGTQSYTPDFYLPSTDEYIEVKGYLGLEQAEKYELFKQTYPDIKWKMLKKTDLALIGALRRKYDKPIIWLVSGVSGSGKSTICESLNKNGIGYVSFDANKNRSVSEIRDLASAGHQNILFDPTVKVSTFSKNFGDEFDIRRIIILGNKEVVRQQLLARNGGVIPTSFDRRWKRMETLAKAAEFSGSADEVLKYLTDKLILNIQ